MKLSPLILALSDKQHHQHDDAHASHSQHNPQGGHIAAVAGGGVSGVVGFSGWVGREVPPGLPVSSYRSREMSAPQADGLAGEVGGIAVHQLCHTRQLPGGGDGELGIRPVIPREIHCPSQRMVEKYSTMTCSSVTPSGRVSA